MTARDSSQVHPHEQIVGYINESGSHEGDWVAREWVRPEKRESVGDFLAAIAVALFLTLGGLTWLAIASASQAAR